MNKQLGPPKNSEQVNGGFSFLFFLFNAPSRGGSSDRQYNESINTDSAVTSESAIHKPESSTRHRPISHGALMSLGSQDSMNQC